MARVLLVDDNDDFREMVAALLRHSGHDVTPINDGRRVGAMLADPGLAIELVVTDIFMPQKDGIEIVLECRTRKVPVIAMSGGDVRGRTDTLQSAGMLGAAATLRKPFSSDELDLAVETALRAR
jgi:DNA-binding response OmpR family regulator